jgi:hypothetical protein
MSVASTDEQSLEARTLRMVIIRAVPFLTALYFVNYLDRTSTAPTSASPRPTCGRSASSW